MIVSSAASRESLLFVVMSESIYRITGRNRDDMKYWLKVGPAV